MNICVIPARGGSKRIPRKNIKPFFAKPMIAYPIEAALKSRLFSGVYVSTEDAEIAQIATQYGALCLKRPSQLADDFTPTVPVIADAIRQVSDPCIRQVCCIYPCTPLLTAELLIAAEHLMSEVEQSYVFPVVPFQAAPQLALKRGNSGSMSPLFHMPENIRTQDLEPAFFDAGQFYWGKVAAWLDELNIHQTGYGMPIASSQAVDIDTLDDWQQAEYLYQAMKFAKEQE